MTWRTKGRFQCKKNGSLTWIYTMSDDRANQWAISEQKKMAAGLDLHHVG